MWAALVVMGVASAGAPAGPPAATHGWAILDHGAAGASLLHLPPRVGANASAPGDARRVRSFSQAPVALAGRGGVLYLTFDPEPGGPLGSQRRVLSLAAERGLTGGWEDDSSERPEALASLPGRPDLLGFVATDEGPVALMQARLAASGGAPDRTERRADAPGEGPRDGWSLLLLCGNDWQRLGLPWDEVGRPARATPPDSDAACRLASTRDGVALWIGRSGAEKIWTGRFEPAHALPRRASEPPTVAWTVHAIPAGTGDRGGAGPPDAFFCIDEQFVALWRSADGTIRLTLLRPGGRFALATVTGVPPFPAAYSVAPLDGSGSLAILWTPGAGAGVGPGTLAKAEVDQLREVSVFTGRVLYAGPALHPGPISPREYQLLSILLAGVMVVVVVFVLRADSDAAPEGLRLPAGVALADPSRRLIAIVLDLIPSAFVVSLALGIQPLDMLDAARLLGSTHGWQPLGATLGLTWLHSTLGEWLRSRSLGKALAGCFVVVPRPAPVPAMQADGTERNERGGGGGGGGGNAEGDNEAVALGRPRLWQAAVRNAIKLLPPLAVLILLDRRRRHPGDLAAGTLVVMVAPEPAPAEGGDDSAQE